MKTTLADLSYSTAAGRWARLGPYYAMFPIPFVERIVSLFSRKGDTVIDPFCGRGTTPFIAMINGRKGVGCDNNPIAWLYSKTKTDPYPEIEAVRTRISQVREAVTRDDCQPINEFQELAFCRIVLGFVNAGKRILNWQEDQLDRTVITMLIQHLHDKKGHGLSNQLRHSRALSPDYCIRWWKTNGYEKPPEIEPDKFLAKRLHWRYAKGTPRPAGMDAPAIGLGKASSCLPKTDRPADLVITSPPYSNVTDYRADNWIRLWALGEGPELPDWNAEQKYTNTELYGEMLLKSFITTCNYTHRGTVWYIRSDARLRTRNMISGILAKILPNHRAYELPAPYVRKTQTALYGDDGPKPGEIDLLYLPPRRKRLGFTIQFKPSNFSFCN
ncbi:MAG: DNA modification methylase [Gemmatimonadetes bacterium]|nr:DNA modification methylase [Gemmatimonadota bacterium]MYB59845.1 DNA modification methylase [Gemmatimonadota bacterium]